MNTLRIYAITYIFWTIDVASIRGANWNWNGFWNLGKEHHHTKRADDKIEKH